MRIIKKLLDVSSLVIDLRDSEERFLQDDIDCCNKYLSTHNWCAGIEGVYYGGGIPGKVAVFLVEITPVADTGADRWLWVVCGDLPSAYIRADLNTTPREALADYVSVMNSWANAVLIGNPLDNEFPVAAAATVGNANGLLSRMQFISQHVIESELLRS